MEVKTVYFDKLDNRNTGEVFRIVKQRAEELGIKTILVATTSGDTAVKAMDALQGLRVIAVSHVTGMVEPNTQELTEENRQIAESKGATILTTAHAFSGVSRAMRSKFKTYTIGQGMKVACEIALMAADSGLVRTDEDVISIAGTGHGADTALVLSPVNTHNFFDLKVKEILCKPRSF